MTLRVLVTGTSHCAALRAAAVQDDDGKTLRWRNLTLGFAAVPNGLFGDMRLRDGVLTAKKGPARRALRHLNRQDRFDLAETDAIVICGGLMSSFGVTRLYNNARWFPLHSLVARSGVPPPGLALISQAAVLAALTGLAEDAPMFPLLRDLRAKVSCPILLVQDPRLSQDSIGARRKHPGLARIAKSPDAAALSALYDSACMAVFGDLALVILQPLETRAGHYFTDARFRRGAVRLAARPDVPQPADDMLHGNADYGGLVLDAIQRALTGGAP